MDNFLLQIIVNELGLRLGGHRVGGIYQIGATDLAIDFYAPNERWLMISTDPQRLAFYLTARNPKQGGDGPRASQMLSGQRNEGRVGSRPSLRWPESIWEARGSRLPRNSATTA